MSDIKATTGDFGAFYRSRKDQLYGFVRSLSKGDEQALDITQEAFFQIWKLWSKGKEPQDPGAYVFKVARNLAVREYSRQKTEPLESVDGGLKPPDLGVVDGDARDEILNLIDCLGRLPEEQREVFLLRSKSELSLSEVAEIVSAPLKTVSSRYKYALVKLKHCMEAKS